MTYPTVFANLAAGNEPLSLFDTMFNVVGQQGNIPCTATGTNAITLTPSTNYYLPAAYTIAQIASFKAAATSTGSVTIQIGGLALVKLFTAAGVQAASGDIVSGTHYEIQYWADLDSNAGGFIILNATVTAIANPLQGAFKNLLITNGGTPNTQVAVTADEAVLQNSGGGTVRVSTVSVTISTATTGANGLDSGSVANSTWYAVYLIYNANTSTTAGLLSTSATSPSLPSGYTYYARYGWVRTNGSANLLLTRQSGRIAAYTVGTAGSTTPNLVVVATGSAGNPSSGPTWIAVSVTAQVPTATASRIELMLNLQAAAYCAAAPNANYGIVTSTTNPPPLFGNGTSAVYGLSKWMMLEATTIQWANSSANNNELYCIGWEDNI